MADENDYTAMVRKAREAAQRKAVFDYLGPRQLIPMSGETMGEVSDVVKDVTIPQTPLDWGLMLAGSPALSLGKRALAAAAGYVLDPDEAKAGPAGAVKKVAEGARRFLFPQFAEEYPAIGPPVMKPKTKKDPVTGKNVVVPGKFFPEKTLTPEAEAFMKERARIADEMEREGYKPYFDPAKRSYVDPSKYPAATTVTRTEAVPAKAETIESYLKNIDAPETMQRLRAAFKRGEELGDTADWYAMAQLEKEYIKEYGAKEGRKAFANEFVAPMAATTSGNEPRANFLIAQFLERQRKLGRPTDIPSHETPATVGGRYLATNMRDYNQMLERGQFMGLGADQPKMYNFGRSFIGDLSGPVMDEQMALGMLEGTPRNIIENTRKGAYGLLEGPVHALAAEKGIQPGNVQDVAWFGFKNMKGQPMISVINDAIERTHRLTGMARDEIVRRGLIRKEIPIYGAGGAMLFPTDDQGGVAPQP